MSIEENDGDKRPIWGQPSDELANSLLERELARAQAERDAAGAALHKELGKRLGVGEQVGIPSPVDYFSPPVHDHGSDYYPTDINKLKPRQDYLENYEKRSDNPLLTNSILIPESPQRYDDIDWLRLPKEEWRFPAVTDPAPDLSAKSDAEILEITRELLEERRRLAGGLTGRYVVALDTGENPGEAHEVFVNLDLTEKRYGHHPYPEE
jgi:hypothetical protein